MPQSAFRQYYSLVTIETEKRNSLTTFKHWDHFPFSCCFFFQFDSEVSARFVWEFITFIWHLRMPTGTFSILWISSAERYQVNLLLAFILPMWSVTSFRLFAARHSVSLVIPLSFRDVKDQRRRKRSNSIRAQHVLFSMRPEWTCSENKALSKSNLPVMAWW